MSCPAVQNCTLPDPSQIHVLNARVTAASMVIGAAMQDSTNTDSHKTGSHRTDSQQTDSSITDGTVTAVMKRWYCRQSASTSV